MDVKRWLGLHWDRVTAWALVALGAGVLLFGWKHVADTPYPAEQIPYVVSAGIGGALLVIFGAALLVSADLRDEWTKLDRIERAMRRAEAARPVEPMPPESEATPDTSAKANGTRRRPVRASAE